MGPKKPWRWFALAITALVIVSLAVTILSRASTHSGDTGAITSETPSTTKPSPGAQITATSYGDGRVLKLAAGSTSATVLPFAGLVKPWGAAVDGAGSVYVVDSGNNRVVELPAR